MASDIYCIDASSLIEIKQRFLRKVFPGVWEEIERLVHGGRLIAPDEVFREIENDDVLGAWARQYRRMFVKPSQEQMDAAKEVAPQFPKLAKPGKFGPAADPFVIGLAHLKALELKWTLLAPKPECIVVSEERGSGGIPAACQHYKLTCLSHIAMFEREGWVFRRSE